MSDARLAGRRVLVTRGADKADRLGPLLAAAGAEVVWVPLIATEPAPGAAEIAPALRALRDHGVHAWVAFASETGVRLTVEAAGAAALDGVRIAAVGPATAAALGAAGLAVDVVAPEPVAESLAAALVERGMRGTRVLVVAALGGRDVLAPALAAAGAAVSVVHAYRSVMPAGAVAALAAAMSTPLDAVTFTSGSTVAHFTRACGNKPLPDCPAVCLGPVTAEAARSAGWARVVTAEPPMLDGMVTAVARSSDAAQPLP